MGHTVVFRGATIRYVDLRQSEAGVFTRLHLTSELTGPVIEAMGWTDIPACFDSAKLEGILTAQSLTLTPNQKPLKEHAVEMEASEVGDFQAVRVKDGDSTRVELRFIARVNQAGAIQWLENYLRIVGTAEGALKVSYVKQEELFNDNAPKATKEQRAATAEDAD